MQELDSQPVTGTPGEGLIIVVPPGAPRQNSKFQNCVVSSHLGPINIAVSVLAARRLEHLQARLGRHGLCRDLGCHLRERVLVLRALPVLKPGTG